MWRVRINLMNCMVRGNDDRKIIRLYGGFLFKGMRVRIRIFDMVMNDFR